MEMEVQHQEPMDAVATPVDAPSPPPPEGPASDDAIMTDPGTSTEPISRSSTATPGPQSSSTTIPSPLPSGVDVDSIKSHEADIGSQLSRELSNPYSTLHASDAQLLALSHSTRSTSPHSNLGSVDSEVEEDELWSPPMGADFSSMRSIPAVSSSFLRTGSRFHGTQQSERQVYDVQVEIKHVDMRESFLCGYLRIQGLTEDHPTLTTYFEGEVIGTKYSFFTQHDDWGANSKVDLNHWGKFSAFRPFQKQARKGPVLIRDASQREHIFMRWKEHFLVPDHRVRTISGASFEGFYYICFNQVKGEVSGIYFHSKSERFQQLELKHVANKGCFAATECR